MLGGMIFHFCLIRTPPEDSWAYWSLARSLSSLGLLDLDGPDVEALLGFDLTLDVTGCVDSFYWAIITMATSECRVRDTNACASQAACPQPSGRLPSGRLPHTGHSSFGFNPHLTYT